MDFNILHLSDLHVTEESDFTKLLTDIKNQTQSFHELVVVITGDIIDKGRYNRKREKIVINFFDQLKQILGTKFKGCFIVPGNHDKTQCESCNLLAKTYQDKEGQIEISKNDWQYQLMSYQNFFKLEDEIYRKLFPNTNINSSKHTNTYGIEVYQNHGISIIFIKIDTSWSSLGGDSDQGRLRISLDQLDYLKSEYKKIKVTECNSKNIFTIALCHHPISWLEASDAKLLQSYLTNEDYLCADVLLCGHTHDVDFQNLFSNTFQLTTLLTGIGWGENTPLEKRNGHRYSLYVFNLRRNSCEVIVRKTDRRGIFDIDREFFPDENSKNSGKLSIPILSRNSHPFIDIPICTNKGLDKAPLFIDEDVMQDIKKISLFLSDFMVHMAESKTQHCRNAIVDLFYPENIIEREKRLDILKDYFYNNNMVSTIDSIFSSNTQYRNKMFTSFLYETCNYFITVFKDIFDREENIRILFRLYDCQKQKYRQICFQSKKNIELEINDEDMYQDQEAREIPFDGIVAKAFKLDSALVSSSNSWVNTIKPKRWDSYLLFIPKFGTNKCNISKSRRNRTYVPYLIGTIAISSKKKNTFLDILNYLEIQDCFSSIISTYLDIFKIDMSKYRVEFANN